MSEANDKIQKTETIVHAPPVGRLDNTKKEWGVTKGLDESGAAGFIAMPGKTEKDKPQAVIFVAVADAKEFLSNFEVVKAGEPISEVKSQARDVGAARGAATYCLAFRGGYALISARSDGRPCKRPSMRNKTFPPRRPVWNRGSPITTASRSLRRPASKWPAESR